MFRKNSWIVALLLVLSLSVFFGCIEVIEDVDTETYTDVDLGTDFNTWGGQAYQSGWSTDGASWNDPNHTAKKIGLSLDDFKGARYLELELNVASTAGAVDIIWGNESNGWNQTNNVAPGGAPSPIKIDLTKLTNYANYAASTTQIRIIVQYNQPGQVKGLVKSAKLMIPNTPIVILPPCDNPECRDLNCTLGKAKCKNFIGFDNEDPTKNYNIPAGGDDTYFWVNLNDFKTTDVENIGNPKVTLGTAGNSINAAFGKYRERLVFKFTPQQAARIAVAGGITVEIDATGTVIGPDTETPRNFQFFIGNAASASNWNATNSPSTAIIENFNTRNELTYTANTKSVDNFAYLILRYESGSATNSVKTEINIKSIKVSLEPGKIVNNFTFAMLQPVAGHTAPKDIENSQLTGTITWEPAVATGGRFKPSTIYYANITISPKHTYNLTNTFVPVITVGGVAQAGLNSPVYNAATRTITTGNFAITGVVPQPNTEDGELDEDLNDTFVPTKIDGVNAKVLWSLEEWYKENNSKVPPFMDAGSTLGFVNGGINVTGRSATWSGLDINLKEIGLRPDLDKIKVTIMGYALGTWNGDMIRLDGNGSPNHKIGQGGTGENTPSGTDKTFTLYGEVPANFLTAATTQTSIRINGDAGTARSFRVTLIVFEKIGQNAEAPAPCTCGTKPTCDCDCTGFCGCVCTTCNPASSNIAVYEIPTGAGVGEFFLDLSKLANVGPASRPNQKYEADATTLFFKAANQRVAIEIPVAQRTGLKTALLNPNQVVKATVVGTITSHGANSTEKVRFNIGGASFWNGVNWADAAPGAETTFTASVNTTNALVTTDYLVIDSSSLTKTTELKIESIKISIITAIKYVKPADTATDFYFDLNESMPFYSDPIASGGTAQPAPTWVVAESNVSYEFTGNQRITIPVSAAMKAALAKAGSAQIVIAGTSTNTGNDVRLFLGKFAGGGWNIGNTQYGTTYKAFDDIKNEYITGFASTEITHFILQFQAASTVSITSIKIVTTPLTIAIIDNFAITLTTPGAGVKPVTSIDSTQFTGTVSWDPALPAHGRFEINTIYTARITITAKAGFTLEGLTTGAPFKVNGNDRASYNPINKLIVSAPFTVTGAKYPICTGCSETEYNGNCTCAPTFSEDISSGFNLNTTGSGTIGTTEFGKIQAARPGSIVKVTVVNLHANGDDRSSWGVGHVGNVNINGAPGPKDVGTAEREIQTSAMTNQYNLYNDCGISKVELWTLPNINYNP